MGKKMKLKLDNLEIQSFVTTVKDEDGKELKGGTWVGWCQSWVLQTDCCGGATASNCISDCTCNPCSKAFTNCPNNGCGGGGGDDPFFGQ